MTAPTSAAPAQQRGPAIRSSLEQPWLSARQVLLDPHGVELRIIMTLVHTVTSGDPRQTASRPFAPSALLQSRVQTLVMACAVICE